MNKKKSQVQHVQQSMGQMVSKAALNQMGPAIEKYVQQQIRQLGSQLAVQQASTLETIFSRVVVLEEIVMEKLGYSKDDLTAKVSDVEDRKENLTLVSDGAVELNDVVRLEVSTKTSDQTEYQGTSRLKVYKSGSGQTIGQELEDAFIGMTTGETKEVTFGKDAKMNAKLTVNRISRPAKSKESPTTEVPDADQTPG